MEDKPIIRPYSGELYHYALKHTNKDYKYIRKEMVNGKMRYYYKDDIRVSSNSKQDIITRHESPDAYKQSIATTTVKKYAPSVKKREYDRSFVGPTKPGETKSLARTTQNAAKPIVNTKTNKHSGSGGNFGDNYNPKSKIDNGVIENVKDLPKQSITLSTNQNQSRVNPDYDRTEPEYSTNCAYCTAAMDLRRRGYDVEARPHDDSYDSNINTISNWYKNTDIKDWTFVGITAEQILKDRGQNSNDAKAIEILNRTLDKTYTDISERYNSISSRFVRKLIGEPVLDLSTPKGQFDAMKNDMLKHGDGAYGQFYLNWSGGSAHSVEWSIEGDRVIIRDAQNNTEWTIDEYFEKYDGYIDYYGYLRTDNREISDEILSTCRKRRGLS